jgi:uncharacterized protein YigE (DUF2233 family)
MAGPGASAPLAAFVGQGRRGRAALMLWLIGLLAAPAAQAACRDATFEGADYTVCSFDVTRDDLRIFWRNPNSEPYRTFSALAAGMESEGHALRFAMNGGMFDAALAPVGLYIEDGAELKPANTADAAGNFHMKPNGVFFLDEASAGVMETGAFLRARPTARFATQSGPMLVIDGEIHPRFIPGSDSLKVRNGVGVSSPTAVHFAISREPVNFDEFARFFRDELGCDNALYLDGTVSGLYAPEIGRNDSWFGFGPIIGVVE